MDKRSFDKSQRCFDVSQSSNTSAPVSKRQQDKLPTLNSRRKIKSLKTSSSVYSFADEDEINIAHNDTTSDISELIKEELKKRRNAR